MPCLRLLMVLLLLAVPPWLHAAPPESVPTADDMAPRVLACVACHGPSGVGVMPLFPRLAGQDPAYLKRQLIYWKADKRPLGAMGSMPAIAKSLSEAEMDAVANYFAAQGVAK